MDYDDQKKDEKLVVAGIGRPTFPERILDEFPELTVTDYLRYRITGQLPEEIEAGLQKGAEKFIEAGLKAARMPKPEAVLPDDFVRPETPEEVARGVELLCAEAERLLKSEEVALPEANRFMAHFRLTAEAAFQQEIPFDPSGTVKPLVEKAEALLENDTGTTEERVVSCAITTAAGGVRHRYYQLDSEQVSRIFTRELSHGRTDTMRAALTVPELAGSTIYNLNRILENEGNPKVISTVFTEVLPGLKSLDEETRNKHLIQDFKLGEYGYMLQSLVSKTEAMKRPLPEKSLQEQATFLIENATKHLRNGCFLCHVNALGILEGLKEIFVEKGVKPEDPEKIKLLVDLIIDRKIKDYPANYPNVSKIKKDISAILEATQKEPLSKNLFRRTFPEKILKFMEDYLPGPVYSFITFKWLRTKDSQ